MAVKQTAGRDTLGQFAPKFAQLNDDVLFGQVWNRTDKLSLRDRSLVTVVALLAQGLTDSSFQYHLATARQNGVTREELAEVLTHAAFYVGWPKAWAAFRMAKDVWAEEAEEEDARPGTSGRWCSLSARPTTALPGTLPAGAICSPSRSSRWAFTT